MENSAANRLPEVDSLPDGFVESEPEATAPVTPLNDGKVNRIGEPDSLSDLSNEALVERKVVKAPKVRTFPVPLSDKDGYDASGESVGVSDDGVRPESAASGLNSSYVGGSDAEASYSKEAHLAENQKSQKETPEVKHKSSKHTFKTDQEFLEFTFKYKQVLEERDAAVAVRDKLESLCRELQRQNKMLMGEFKKASEEGQSLRSDLSTKFEDAIKEVGIKLEKQKEESLNQLKENELLREKIKQLAEQYRLSQQQCAQELKQKTLEIKIAELSVQQTDEKLVHEQAQLKAYAEKISQLLETEKSLRLQLSADGEKFQQFQDALLKSNEVFETFKLEIDKMAKSTKELKKENTFLKSKCERSDFTLIELVEERERMKQQQEKTKNQKEKLESLCRSLQAERKQRSDSSSQPESVQL